MNSKRHATLVQFLKHRADEHLRSVFRYTADDYDVLYLRSDLRTEQLKQVLPTLHARILESQGLVAEHDYPRLGAVQATTEIHEHGILLHFVETETQGTVVTLGREVGQDLAGFVEECNRILMG